MGDVQVDAGELAAYGRDLAVSPGLMSRRVGATVKRAAQNVKTSVMEDVQGSSNAGFRRIRVAYETGVSAHGAYADIAPVDGGASDLANIAFFGTARGGGTHRFYEHAEEELPVLADYVARLVGEVT